MQVVIIIIVIVVVFALLQALVEKIGDGAKLLNGFIKNTIGWPWLITTAILCIASNLIWGLGGMFIVLGICCALRFIWAGINNISDKNRETADINRQTQQEAQKNNNEAELIRELNTNCTYLGCMNSDMWVSKLPNYANKQYTTSFSKITSNFAKQMEKQYITNNDSWFEPFIEYLVMHPQGATPTKMLAELPSPTLRITHVTPDIELLTAALNEGTRKANTDVPALFEAIPINTDEILYKPTKYAMKRFGEGSANVINESSNTEINFDDL
jgi:hypothetical protein